MADIHPGTQEEEGFIEEQAPEDVRDFLIANDIGDKYQIILKERPKEGGKALVLKTFTNNCPTIDEIGRQWGPGDYILAISYKVPGMNGVPKPTIKNMSLCLPERAWGELHDDYLEERRQQKKERQSKQWEDEAHKSRVLGGPTTPGVSDLEQLDKAMGILSKFGINPGARPEAPNKKTFGETLVEMAPVITALTPLVLGLLGTRKEGGNPNNELLNTLVTHMLVQKPPSETESMKQITGFLMTTMKQVLDMKEAMKPAEKESFVEKIFDKLVASGPMLAQILKMSAEKRESNFMVKQVRDSKDVKALHEDPEMQEMMIKRMDEFYGTDQTNQILAVMGFARRTPPQPQPTPTAPEPAPGAEPARDSVSGPAPMAGGPESGEGGDDDLFPEE